MNAYSMKLSDVPRACGLSLLSILSLCVLLAAACSSPTPIIEQSEGTEAVVSEASEASEVSEVSEEDRALAAVDFEAEARQAWTSFAAMPHRCDSFDYFPGGGMYTFYCRLKNFMTVEQLQARLPIPIFLDGPHVDGRMNHASTTDFGRYNPAFVERLANWTLPALKDDVFRRATQPIYDDYVRPLARTYWMTFDKLAERHDYWEEEQEALEQAMAGPGTGEMYYERFFDFMDPGFIPRPERGAGQFVEREYNMDGIDGNVVKTAVGFWIRRGIDGTADIFSRGLRELIYVYDKEFLGF